MTTAPSGQDGAIAPSSAKQTGKALLSVFALGAIAPCIDLRKRVVGFVTDGGSKAEASRRYKVSLWCVNDWCQREYLTPQAQQGRKRKLDWEALSRHIQEYPDALIRERAQHFGVHNNAIWYANRQMKLTRKKNSKIQ